MTLPAAAWRGLGIAAAAFGSALIAVTYVARFLLPADPAALWLPAEQTAADAAAFARAWPVFVLYAAAAVAALASGLRALPPALASGRASPAFLFASLAAAIAGIALGTVAGADALGGATMVYFWWGLAVMWIIAVVRIATAARAGSPVVVRDWTVYAFGLALVPLTSIPQVPLWLATGTMTLDEAALTAATLSFAGHYVAAQFVIVEVL